MRNDIFEWDEEKNLYNKRVHKISFESAVAVFDDKFRLEIFDEKHSEFEDRFKTIGAINGHVVIVTKKRRKAPCFSYGDIRR